jgi:hypothetical protein
MRVDAMLCPCCGINIPVDSAECSCGARFVGIPLDQTPIRVLRLGPAITSVGLLAAAILASIVITKWLAFTGLLVVWFAWRAMKASKKEPQLYGGYRTATAAFAISVAGVLGISSYATVRIPEVIDNFRAQEIAATQAEMYRWCSAIEEEKRLSDNYPSAQDFKAAVGSDGAKDYWDRPIRYQSISGHVADAAIGKPITGMNKNSPSGLGALTSFELRSAGPDGVMGTDDDIVMRDGIFITNPEQKKPSAAQQIR